MLAQQLMLAHVCICWLTTSDYSFTSPIVSSHAPCEHLHVPGPSRNIYTNPNAIPKKNTNMWREASECLRFVLCCTRWPLGFFAALPPGKQRPKVWQRMTKVLMPNKWYTVKHYKTTSFFPVSFQWPFWSGHSTLQKGYRYKWHTVSVCQLLPVLIVFRAILNQWPPALQPSAHVAGAAAPDVRPPIHAREVKAKSQIQQNHTWVSKWHACAKCEFSVPYPMHDDFRWISALQFPIFCTCRTDTELSHFRLSYSD